MSFWRILLVALMMMAAASAVQGLRSLRRRRHHYRMALDLFFSTPADRRWTVFRPLLNDQDVNAAAWYLHGAVCLRDGRVREAARALGIAHHADWRLQTAALLTFAALKAANAENANVLEQIVQTWREMKEPNVWARKEDRLLIESLSKTTRPAPALSSLGRLAWAVVGPMDQDRLERLALKPPAWAQPMFQGP